LDEIPYKASFGVIGSYIGAVMNFLCLAAQFYVAIWPLGGAAPDAEVFFEAYLALPLLILLYVIWKAYSWGKFPTHRALYVKIKDIDVMTGLRPEQLLISGPDVLEADRRHSVTEMQAQNPKGPMGWVKRITGTLI
jgi:amino acid transporter